MQNRFAAPLWSAFIRLPLQTLNQFYTQTLNRMDSAARQAIQTLDHGSQLLLHSLWKTGDSIAIYVDDIQKYERWAEESPRLHPAVSRR